MTSLKINLQFLELDWKPQDADRDASWELYIELLTRVTTQGLRPEDGSEASALESIYTILPLTRETIKRHRKLGNEFTKIAIVILNQVLRPFTAKWHRLSLTGAFEDKEQRATFRNELVILQENLRKFSQMLADMAGVEDLTTLENR